jgi:hypothetical protein
MKRKWFTKVWIPIVMALLLVATIGAPVLGATTAVVTVTQEPAFIGIAIDHATITLNGLTGSGLVAPNTVYYTNPLGDTTPPSATVLNTECYFTITNSSTVATDLTGNLSDFSGGDNSSTNSNDGSNDGATYGAYAYYSGQTFSGKVLLKSTGSATGNFSSDLAATTNIKIGFQVETQTTAWAGGDADTATLTITATAH